MLIQATNNCQTSFRCEMPVEVTWNKKDLRDDVERPVMFSLTCGLMEAGKWRMTVQRAGVENPFTYEVDMLFMDLGDGLDSLGPNPDLGHIDLLQGMWSMDSVTTLPLPDFYNDHKRSAAPFYSGNQNHHDGHIRHRRHVKVPRRGFLYQWVVCSGGLVTVILSGLFSFHTLYLPLSYPSRHQKRALYYSVSIVLVTCLVQSLLCTFLCDHND